MQTIEELEAAVNTEQEALERAYQAANPVSIAIYSTALRRAEEALLAERIRRGDW